MKICPDCGQKDLKRFHSYDSYCKDCRSKRTSVTYYRHRHETEYMEARRRRSKEWADINLSRSRQHHANAAARRRGAEGTFTEEEFLELCNAWDWLCVYCERELNEHTVVREHVIPLHHGGDNTIHNILPSCADCNTSKGSKSLGQWLGERN